MIFDQKTSIFFVFKIFEIFDFGKKLSPFLKFLDWILDTKKIFFDVRAIAIKFLSNDEKNFLWSMVHIFLRFWNRFLANFFLYFKFLKLYQFWMFLTDKTWYFIIFDKLCYFLKNFRLLTIFRKITVFSKKLVFFDVL